MKAKQAGILSALLASTCCIGPLLLVAIGVGSAAALIGRYHWFFLITGMAVLAWAWAKYLREKTVCDCENRPMGGRRSGMLTLLVTTVLVLGFAGLNISRYVFATTPAAVQTQTPLANGLNRIVLSVEGTELRDLRNSGTPRAQANRWRRIRACECRDQNCHRRLRTDENESGTISRGNQFYRYRATLPNKVNDSASM